MSKNGENYTTISILPSTKEKLGRSMPKTWDWDKILCALADMWENQQGKGVKTGKSPQDS